MKKIIFLVLLYSGSNLSLNAESARIFADGKFNDWDSIAPIHIDPAGDQLSGNLDFTVLKIVNDEKYLFVYLHVGTEMSLQNDNEIHLYLDTDNNSSTGHQINGIGAELDFTFGYRNGDFYLSSGQIDVYHNDLGLVTCPTVTSDAFEIVLSRSAVPDSTEPLFPQNQFRIVFADQSSGADNIPDSGSLITYEFTDTPLPPIAGLQISKADTSFIRLMSYNVERDALFDPDKEDEYERIFNAANPQIIAFQEIYDHNSQQTANLVEDFLPSEPGEDWYHAKTGPDIITVSRFAITEYLPINGNGAFLLDLPDDYETDLLLINAHLPAGNNEEARQDEIDNIMSFIREAKNQTGPLNLQPLTPIIITGDMNLVGYAEQLNTFITGEILQTTQYGPAFDPDWDGSDLRDLSPRHPDEPFYFTWYNAYSSYSPGRLDFAFITDFVVELSDGFILFTPWINPDTLAAYNLEPDDATSVSDHVPLVFDFKPVIPDLPEIDNITIFIDSEDVVLSWETPPVNFGAYKIYRSNTPYFQTAPGNLLAEIPASASGTVYFQDSDVIFENSAYFYVVTNSTPSAP